MPAQAEQRLGLTRQRRRDQQALLVHASQRGRQALVQLERLRLSVLRGEGSPRASSALAASRLCGAPKPPRSPSRRGAESSAAGQASRDWPLSR